MSSCADIARQENSGINQTNQLLEQYKKMRINHWGTYTKKTRRSVKKVPRPEKPKSISIEHLKNNPIFQQVTQIHCFKIRASESRCEAIKYLAMTTCGDISKEREIKKYSKCLDKNFK